MYVSHRRRCILISFHLLWFVVVVVVFQLENCIRWSELGLNGIDRVCMSLSIVISIVCHHFVYVVRVVCFLFLLSALAVHLSIENRQRRQHCFAAYFTLYIYRVVVVFIFFSLICDVHFVWCSFHVRFGCFCLNSFDAAYFIGLSVSVGVCVNTLWVHTTVRCIGPPLV